MALELLVAFTENYQLLFHNIAYWVQMFSIRHKERPRSSSGRLLWATGGRTLTPGRRRPSSPFPFPRRPPEAAARQGRATPVKGAVGTWCSAPSAAVLEGGFPAGILRSCAVRGWRGRRCEAVGGPVLAARLRSVSRRCAREGPDGLLWARWA
jgi:hypothetical protein